MSTGPQGEIVYTFGGTHEAIASEGALLAAGLAVRVMPLPAQIGAGCGLCLRVEATARPQADAALAAAGLQPEGTWRQTGPAGRRVYEPC